MWRARYLLVAAFALGACGEATLDTGGLEREIASGVEDETGTREVSVDCPEDIEQEEGARFECEATAPGGIRQKVSARQVDDEGGVDWKLVRP